MPLDVSDPALVVVEYIALVVLVVAVFEALRDWLDSPTLIHAFAVACAAVGLAPACLLTIDVRAQLTRPALSTIYAASTVAIDVFLFILAPGLLALATHRPTPLSDARRGRGCRFAMGATLGALLGVGLALVGPLLAVARRGGLPASVPWTAWLSHASDGPRACWLLCGTVVLASHAASGSVILPAVLAPPTRARRNAQLIRLHHSIGETREQVSHRSGTELARGELACIGLHRPASACIGLHRPASAWSGRRSMT